MFEGETREGETMGLPENDPHVRFLIKDSWYAGIFVGLGIGGGIGIVGMLVLAYAA